MRTRCAVPEGASRGAGVAAGSPTSRCPAASAVRALVRGLQASPLGSATGRTLHRLQYVFTHHGSLMVRSLFQGFVAAVPDRQTGDEADGLRPVQAREAGDGKDETLGADEQRPEAELAVAEAVDEADGAGVRAGGAGHAVEAVGVAFAG